MSQTGSLSRESSYGNGSRRSAQAPGAARRTSAAGGKSKAKQQAAAAPGGLEVLSRPEWLEAAVLAALQEKVRGWDRCDGKGANASISGWHGWHR
jgi:hypothetical protein